MKDFSLHIPDPESVNYDGDSLAVATEWLVSILRWAVLILFAFLRPYLAPGIPAAQEPFYAFILLGALYNLYVSYLLACGQVVRDIPRFLTFFVFIDILILVALAYFSNIYQAGLLVFYLLMIVMVALRASLRLSLILGPIMILAYFFSTYYLLDPSLFNPGRMILDSLGLLVLTAFCGWFSEGKSRAWKALYQLSQRFKAVNKSLGETQRRLEIYRRLDEMRRDFIAMMSHELRTPLTAVIGNIDLLLLGKAGDLSERQRHFLEAAVNEGENLEKLISNLLDLSLIQSGRWKLDLAKVGPHDLLSRALGTIGSRAREKGVRLVADESNAAEMPRFIADGEKVMKVLDNLLGNAVKFSPEGSTVEVSVRETDDQSLRERLTHLIATAQVVTFTIRDHGPGIPAEDKSLVFESFHRSRSRDSSQLPRGGGLGLAIAKEIVDLHWGRIWYEETPGGGCTFHISFPVSPLRPRHRIALVYSNFQLEHIIDGLLVQFQGEMERKKLHLIRKGWETGGGAVVRADRQLLQSLFFNIINNQIRYAASGTDFILKIQHSGPGGSVMVTTRNNGEVMNWDHLERLRSGETEREDVKRDLRQVSVGLSLARDIIETHGGHFFVDNLERGGVEITVSLPPSPKEV